MILTQQPLSLVPAGNDAVYVASGNTFSDVTLDYKYVANVYSNGALSVTLKAFPDTQFGLGVFNLKNIAAAFVGSTFHTLLSQDIAVPIDVAPPDSAKLQLVFGEEYINPTFNISNQFIQTSGLTISTSTPYFNGSLSFVNQNAFSGSTYVNATGITGINFLQNYGGPQKPAYLNERQFLYYYTKAGAVPSAVVKTYGANGANLGVYTITNPNTTLDGVQFISVGYPQLAGLTAGSQYTVTSGQNPMMQSNVDTYTVQLGSGSTFTSIPIKYKVTQDCTNKWAPYAYTVHWLNEFGGYDSWYFNRMNRTTSDINQTKIKRTYGTLNSNGTYSIANSNRGIVQQFTQYQDTIQLSTEGLYDYDVQYLKGLWHSPVVYLESVQTGVIIAATVSGDPYITKRRVNDKFFAVSLNFESAMSDFSQVQ